MPQRPRLPLLLLLWVPAATLVVVTDGCAGRVDYAATAAAQGRPGGAWASPACRVDDLPLCRVRCAQHKADACNNLGVIEDLHGSADKGAAAELYRIACKMGSAGACFNQSRLTVTSPPEPAAPRAREPAPVVDDQDRSVWVRGELTIDGVTFTSSTCHSTEPQGFLGADLEAASGERVRIIPSADGSAVVIVHMRGDSPGLPQKGCAKAQMAASGIKKDGVSLVEGSARFDCHAKVQVLGDLRFRCGP